ncbi:MAG: FAD-dependent oxidoreductase, partial [Firmicutes bacterium]|nr:FAD-dependent oxidoreductase [Bacillota bacterium]
DKEGVWNALDFLSAYNRSELPEIEGPVVVVGGGNAALDSARSALRLPGVHHVTLVYRRGRAEMPADQTEVEAAEKEGVELIFNAMPREIRSVNGNAREIVFDFSKTNLNGLIIDRTKSFKKRGKTVIMALGQNADHSVLGALNEARSFIAGGDLTSGPATVPEAIRAGRIAAEAIICNLEGKPGPSVSASGEKPVSFEELNLASRINMQPMEHQAEPTSEAGRCLGCGTCNSCGICYLFCPDLAVDNVNGRYEFNLDYCKGCGICVKECPARALVMEGGS